MALFDSFRKLVGKAKTGDLTSPEEIARAAGLLEEHDRLNEASVLLGEGVKLFPEASALRTQHDRVERRRLRERIANLSKTLEARPNPAAALELARIYRQTGDTVSARSVAAQAVEKFADYAPLHQVLGELWMDIYEQSGVPQDGITALRSLERCLALDGGNLAVRERLLEFFGKIGAWRNALEQSVKLLNCLRPGLTGRIATEALGKQNLAEEDVEGLIRRRRRTQEDVPKVAFSPSVEEDVRRSLRLFDDLRGRRMISVVWPDGVMREAGANERMDRDALAKSVNALKSAATECCSLMGIGGFVMAEMETPDSAVYLKVLSQAGERDAGATRRSASLFVLTNDAARRREVLARLSRV